MSTIKATFWWRLDPGKGIDLLLEILPQFLSQAQHSWEFHIFGTGSLEAQIQQIIEQYPDIITLYGRATRDQIKPVAQAWDYCLCPSQLLESFGMTALEWCKLWLPVIGPSKWWLAQFIVSDFAQFEDISLDWRSLIKLLLYIDQHHDQNYHSRQSQTLQIASKFGPSQRLQKINKLIDHSA